MTTKITLTLAQADQGTDEAMATTVALLLALGVAPLNKVTLVLECKDEDAEGLVGDLRAVLGGRPVGIEAKIKTQKVSVVTPMDRAGWN